MIYKIEVNPFDQYYINCYFNALASIITYYDKSYNVATYMNSYLHTFSHFEDLYFPYLGNNYEFYHNFEQYFEKINCNFMDKLNYLEEVKHLIRDKTYIFVGVDLFYWNKYGSVYGIEHLRHRSLIVGYDDSNSTILALEDDLGYSMKYYVHTFTEKELNTAVLSLHNDFQGNVEYDYTKLKLIKEIEPYILSLDKVKENARSIINNLKTDKFVNFNINGQDFTKRIIPDEFFRVHTRYSNRFVANKLLFLELRKLKLITVDQEEELKNYCDKIIHNVDSVKLILMKHKLTKKPINPGKIESKWRLAFIFESEMWNKLLNY